jgi:simple sugar transport system ATP-binding protein
MQYQLHESGDVRRPGRADPATGRECVALLDVRSISKSFGAIRALTDVCFSVDAGEVVGLMGDNGAGNRPRHCQSGRCCP